MRPRRDDYREGSGTFVDVERRRRELLTWLVLVAAGLFAAVLWALALS